MAPKRRASSAKTEAPATTTAAKRRKSATAKPAEKAATSTQTTSSRRKKESATATASTAAPASAKKGRARTKPEPEAPKETPPSKRTRLQAVPEEEEVLQPVEHCSHQKVAGEMFVLGNGDCGQFGKGEDAAEALRPSPSDIPGKQVIQVAAGGMHSVALTSDGEVWTTGVNDEGALGRETAGELWEKSAHAQGAPTDSYTWGRVSVPSDHGKIVQASAGDSHSVALTELGAIYAWGTFRDSSGVFGFSPSERIAVLPTLVYSPSQGSDQAVKIASGADHVMALTRGGALLSWGTGQQGQLGRVGTRLPERTLKETLLRPHPVPFTRRIRGVPVPVITDFACGTYGTFALSESGHVYAWGLNNYGQLGLPGQEPVYSPALVRALESKKVVLIRAGQHHSLFLTEEGSLLSCGRPTYGRLGRSGISTDSDEALPEPGEVDVGGSTIVAIAAGLEVSGAVSDNGKAWLWGMGTNGQLGKGDDDADEAVPKALVETKRFSGRKVIQLEFGGQHALLLTQLQPAAAPQAEAAPQAAAAAAEPMAVEEAEPAAKEEEVQDAAVEAEEAPAGNATKEAAPAVEAAPSATAPAAAATPKAAAAPSRKRRVAAAGVAEPADGTEAPAAAPKPKRARKTKAAIAEAVAAQPVAAEAAAGDAAADNGGKVEAAVETAAAPEEAAPEDAVMEPAEAGDTAGEAAAAAAEEEAAKTAEAAAPAEEAQPMAEEAAPVKAAAPSKKRKAAAANGRSQRKKAGGSVSQAELVPQPEAAPAAPSEAAVAAEPAATQDAMAQPPAADQSEAVMVAPQGATIGHKEATSSKSTEAVGVSAEEPVHRAAEAAAAPDEAGAASEPAPQPAPDALDAQPGPLNGDTAMGMEEAAPVSGTSNARDTAEVQPKGALHGIAAGNQPASNGGPALGAGTAAVPQWEASMLAEATAQGSAGEQGGPLGTPAQGSAGAINTENFLVGEAASDVPSAMHEDKQGLS